MNGNDLTPEERRNRGTYLAKGAPAASVEKLYRSFEPTGGASVASSGFLADQSKIPR